MGMVMDTLQIGRVSVFMPQLGDTISFQPKNHWLLLESEIGPISTAHRNATQPSKSD